MTDISEPNTPEDPVTPTTSGLTPEQLAALVDELRDTLAEMLNAGIDEALAAQPTIKVNSGTVRTVIVNDGTTSAGTAKVDMDGDEEGGEIIAQVINERPIPGDRVVVMFVPPSSAMVIGHVGGSGLPGSSLISYVGRIDAEFGGSGTKGPPRGYARPYGQVVKQAAAPWAFAEIGTTLNTGGEATDEFRMIDMRGRIPIGLDNMGGSDAGVSSLANTIGTSGGAESHTLSQSNMPSYSLSVSGGSFSGSVSINSATSNTSLSFTPIISGGGVPYDAGGVGSFGIGGGINDGGHSHTGSVSGSMSGQTASSGGSGSSVNHLPPVRVVHWLVKL